MTFYAIGVSRHRLGSDGVGVTTLVGGFGCPLDCKYCLNPQCKRPRVKVEYSVGELYRKVAVDDLYFEATGGGITFGGGEPLLQAGFIREFVEYTRKEGKNWRYSLETCLAVDEEKLSLLDGLIDEYIVDVKDMNEGIYRSYTGADPYLMRQNLMHLLDCKDKVRIKLPLIPDYNTASDVLRSETELREMGFENFERLRYIKEINK